MSHSYFTRKLLNIKDKNITFLEDSLEEVKLNGITSFIFKGIIEFKKQQWVKAVTELLLEAKTYSEETESPLSRGKVQEFE